jgi:hypothetical protein
LRQLNKTLDFHPSSNTSPFAILRSSSATNSVKSVNRD